MVRLTNFQAWDVTSSGNKVIVITTRNFLPELGGMQVLMTDIANQLAKYSKVKVYAEVSTGSKEFDEVQNYEIIRIKGFKFITKFRKANQIQDFLTHAEKLTLRDVGSTFFIGDIFAIKHENLDSRIYLT